jgi:hypothetical protein
MASPEAARAQRDTLDVGRALGFVFDDPDWVKKLLIGGLFQLLATFIVGAFFTAGYGLRLIRRVAAGEPRPLPEWDDLGGMFVEGARAVALYLAHLLILGLIPASLGCVVVLVTGGVSALGRDGNPAVAGPLAVLGIFVLYALAGLVMLVLMVYLPAAFVRLALRGTLASAFELRENVAFIRRNPLNYVLALVLYFIASFLAQFGFLVCCVGYLPAFFWAICVFAWGLGETARRDSAASASPARMS